MEERIGRIAAMDFKRRMSIETLIDETRKTMIEYPNKWQEWNTCWVGKTLKEIVENAKNKPSSKSLLFVRLGKEETLTIFIVPRHNTLKDLEENHTNHMNQL